MNYFSDYFTEQLINPESTTGSIFYNGKMSSDDFFLNPRGRCEILLTGLIGRARAHTPDSRMQEQIQPCKVNRNRRAQK